MSVSSSFGSSRTVLSNPTPFPTFFTRHGRTSSSFLLFFHYKAQRLVIAINSVTVGQCNECKAKLTRFTEGTYSTDLTSTMWMFSPKQAPKIGRTRLCADAPARVLKNTLSVPAGNSRGKSLVATPRTTTLSRMYLDEESWWGGKCSSALQK